MTSADVLHDTKDMRKASICAFFQNSGTVYVFNTGKAGDRNKDLDFWLNDETILS
jgi:hypothetical protein